MFFLGNWFASWWRKLCQTKALKKTRSLSPRRRRFPLMLEALEQRLTPSVSAVLPVLDLGASGATVHSQAIATDTGGNRYVTGDFSGTVNFGSNTLTATGFNSGFVAKYGPTGAVLWAVGFEGSQNLAGSGIAVDGSENVYTTGSFSGTGTFDQSHILTSGGDNLNAFVSKLDSAGHVLWAADLGDGSTNAYGTGIAVDSSGVYSTGSFGGTGDFNPTGGTANLIANVGIGNAYVSKLNTDGSFGWALDLGIVSSTSVKCHRRERAHVFVRLLLRHPGRTGLSVPTNAFVAELSTSSPAVAWAKDLGMAAPPPATASRWTASATFTRLGKFTGTADFDPTASSTPGRHQPGRVLSRSSTPGATSGGGPGPRQHLDDRKRHRH